MYGSHSYIINIFIGISVDEIHNLIKISKIYNIDLRIKYVLNVQDILMAIFPALIRSDICASMASKSLKDAKKNSYLKDKSPKFSAEEESNQKMTENFVRIIDKFNQLDERVKYLYRHQENIWNNHENLSDKLGRMDKLTLNLSEKLDKMTEKIDNLCDINSRGSTRSRFFFFKEKTQLIFFFFGILEYVF